MNHSSFAGPFAAASALLVDPRWPGDCSSVVIIAAGGRDLLCSPATIAAALRLHTAGLAVHRLFHGGGRGADQVIDRAARCIGWPVEVIPADWARYGRSAGPRRNGLLLRRACLFASTLRAPERCGLLVIAFPGNRGTASLLEQARRLKAQATLPIAIRQLPA